MIRAVWLKSTNFCLVLPLRVDIFPTLAENLALSAKSSVFASGARASDVIKY